MEPLQVSIVTPVLNGARFLPEAVASIQAQDYPRIEHIVVDGGSTDGTLDLLERTPGIVWITGKDRGMYDAINRGFAMSHGEILAYQNADDRYVVPGAVSSAVRQLVERPDVEVVYGDFRYIDEDGRPARRRPPKGRAFDAAALRRYNYVPPHSTFVRRRVVTGEGHWFDPSLRFAGDWDWVLGMALAGRRFAHLDEVLSEFRVHGRSKTSTLGWKPKLAEWHRICRKNRASLVLLVWNEAVYVPVRRRLGLTA